MEFHPVEIPGCAPKSLWKFSACGDNRELSMLSSRSNQLVTTPPLPPLPPFQRIMGYRNERMEICIGASAVAADVTSVKKKEGKKKREKNATYEQIFAPASNNGTTEHPSPLYVHLPPCLDSVIKQTFTISLLFPTTRVVFRYLPPNRDITPSLPLLIANLIIDTGSANVCRTRGSAHTHAYAIDARPKSRPRVFSIFRRELHRRSLEDVSTRDKYRAGCPLGREGDGV